MNEGPSESIGHEISRMPMALAVVALFGAQALNAQNNAPYYDDTHEILRATGMKVERIEGSFGYEQFRHDQAADGKALALDVRNADFIVANSRNANPTNDFDCEQGSLPVNRYPVSVYNADFTALIGGLIRGEIPQEADWEPLYCNSAAVLFNFTAVSGIIDGIRITQAWDAVRVARESSGLYVKNSWISNVRDDAVENDDLLSIVFEDNLVDGTFQGISVASGGDFSAVPATTVRMSGNVIRLREYLYKGGQRYGAPFKNEDFSPVSVLHDNAIAVDYAGGSTSGSQWERTWSKVEECSNNLFLWLSDLPIPPEVGTPPACFTVMTGQEARDRWEEAKQNWIDCHPRVARIAGDPASDPTQCEADTFGGYTGTLHTAPMPPRLHAIDQTGSASTD